MELEQMAIEQMAIEQMEIEQMSYRQFTLFTYLSCNSSNCLVTFAVTVPITSPGIVLISFVRSQSSPQNSKMVSNRPPG